MKATLAQMVNSVDTIKKLTKAELPIKLAFRFISLTKQIDEKLKVFEEARVELIKKYGIPTEDGGVRVAEENVPAFNSEYSSLLSEQVELDIQKISLDAFPETLTLSATELVQIEWLIEV